ncbi:MAG: DUF5652 family protein [Nanoarchaeota archaeon]|nr:DUF5652 family protein [Nanoarchaeota archaeon]
MVIIPGLEVSTTAFTILLILTFWELIWKLIALWNCGKNNHLGWFIAIGVINTVGILPIVYLLFFNKKKAIKTAKVKRKRR